MNSNSSGTKKKHSKRSKNESSYELNLGGLDTINEMSDQLTSIANVSAIAARFLVTLLCLSLTLSFRTALWLLVSGKPQLG